MSAIHAFPSIYKKVFIVNFFFAEFVYPICLAKAETQETEMWLSGWGKTETRTYDSN